MRARSFAKPLGSLVSRCCRCRYWYVSSQHAHSLNTIFWFEKLFKQTKKNVRKKRERKKSTGIQSIGAAMHLKAFMWRMWVDVWISCAAWQATHTHIHKWIAFNTNRTSWPIVYSSYNSSAFRCRGGGESCSPYIPKQNEFSRASSCLFGFILVESLAAFDIQFLQWYKLCHPIVASDFDVNRRINWFIECVGVSYVSILDRNRWVVKILNNFGTFRVDILSKSKANTVSRGKRPDHHSVEPFSLMRPRKRCLRLSWRHASVVRVSMQIIVFKIGLKGKC